ncbi:aminotransferase class III-fold pyridoxal phosphate-dependent enzyme [Streptomyces sp. UNOB3_S3]|uniref:aminotransferase class III-fold pyridoxal phosphate-dependent enzyme n=1 Tax=Streptomyces sp. UNOB3_S3 TaxID=2871682 RepID=UPI001E457853|nr:aminotransferase class III-fold pyridoxal phosphate-dependent enzyme [Streptomyces sp. UNOB3_S3]MCC3775602.1 aminotransferase class III-fold pyridoxal phosphate-dependent enzyme [Streptomyces sp. UNOB3_S3]
MTPPRLPPPAPPLARRSGRAGILRRQPAREPSARTYARSLPVVPVRARGLTIEGADGRRYLDCLSGGGALALGHNHPVVLEAIRAVLDSGAPLQVPDLATPVQEAFAAELFATLPRGLADSARIRFCGPATTDAMADAFRLVRAATGRDGLLALAGDGPAEDADATGCPLGDAHRGMPLPAGLVVEPVLGDAVLPVPEERLRRIRDITAARAVPLIADEAWTGAGRTGAFWAVEHSGVVPDVMVLSKAIGGSLPLAVIVHRDDLDARPSHRDPDPAAAFQADEFQGNQLAMAAGAATLRHIRENGLDRRAAVLGARMLERLRRLAREHECVADVRGKGLMIGIEFTDQFTDPGTGPAPGPEAGRAAGPATSVPGRRPSSAAAAAAAALAETVRRECLRRGLIVGLSDRRPPVIRLLPPLTLTDEQAEAVLDRLSDAVAAASAPSAGTPPPDRRP